MSADEVEPPGELLRAAMQAAESDLPARGESPRVGWFTLPGQRASSRSHNEVDLRQLYYRASLDRPGDLYAMPAAAIGCLWKLDVLVHEHAAWIAHGVGSGASALDHYLTDTLTRDAATRDPE